MRTRKADTSKTLWRWLSVWILFVPRVSALPFLSTWDTESSQTITLPLTSAGTYDFAVDWGDESTSHITAYNQAEVIHSYNTDGSYNISITGTIQGWRFNNAGDPTKLLLISQWGDLQLGNEGQYFHGCSNLQVDATDAPNLSLTTSLTKCFRSCSVFNGDINNWDVSNVNSFNKMFYSASSFNLPIGTVFLSHHQHFLPSCNSSQLLPLYSRLPFSGDWNTSSVTTFYGMFYESAFNQPIGTLTPLCASASLTHHTRAHLAASLVQLSSSLSQVTGIPRASLILCTCSILHLRSISPLVWSSLLLCLCANASVTPIPEHTAVQLQLLCNPFLRRLGYLECH